MMASLFGYTTPEGANKARKAAENQLQEELEEILKKEQETRERLDADYHAKLKEIKRSQELEMELLEEKCLAETNKKRNEYIRQSNEAMKAVEKKDQHFRDDFQKTASIFKQNGLVEIVKQKERNDRNQIELKQINDACRNELRIKQEIDNLRHQEQLEIMRRHEEQRRIVEENYKESLLELQKERREVMKKRENLLGELDDKELEMRREHLERVTSFKKTTMTTNVSMITAICEEGKHDDHRSECLSVVVLFKRVRAEFDNEESRMTGTIDEMEFEMEVTNPPNFDEAIVNLLSLMNELQFLTVDNQQTRNLQQDTLKTCESCKSTLTSLRSKLDIYPRHQLNREMSRKTREEIKELYQSANHYMQNLSELIDQFNIAPKRLLENTISENLRTIFHEPQQISNLEPSQISATWSQELMEIECYQTEQVGNNEPSEEDLDYIAEEEI